MTQTVPARPLVAIFWMLVTGLCFVAVTALVKYLGSHVPAPQAAFLRYLMGLVFLLPLVPQMRAVTLTPRLHGLFAARGLMHAIGVGLWFFSMTRIPIAEVTALNYLSPIFVTLGAAVFLKEHLAARRIAAIAVALIGAIIILRPGFREIGPGHTAMLLAGLVFGGSYLLAKVTVDAANPAIVVGMLSVWVTVALAPWALSVWVQPTWGEIGILFCVAIFATGGHYTMTLALAAAPVAVTQPVTFLQLIWATLLGAWVFAEPIDIWVALGGGLILGAISFIAWREARLKRRAITPPVPATKL